MAELAKLKSLGDWPKMRRGIEGAVTAVMGKPPKNPIDLQVKVVEDLDVGGVSRQRINYFVDDWTRVAAWLFVPDTHDEKPAIICCHQMTAKGKDEPAGLDDNGLMAFARHYAERGYVTIAPDCITAGERVSSSREPYDTSAFYKDNPKQSALGKMLFDHMRCVDLLEEMREVDSARIGVLGHDIGGYNALLLAAFDERVQACVASCGFTRFAEDARPDRWSGASKFVPLPKLSASVAKGEYPFDWDDVLALLAPSPTFIVTALNDEILSNTKSCAKAVSRAQKVYKLLGAEEAMQDLTHEDGHTFTREALDAADDWFDRWL
ncbi:MAG: dienelactone hydrolase family protein [Candidatus Hydrogenedentes bacterium]|nr:dienelactone hydrolase family protein [Candidatus Hydrogenedentota bacterium]